MARHSPRDGNSPGRPRMPDKRPPTPRQIRGTYLLNAYIAGNTVPLLDSLKTKIRIAKIARVPYRVSRLADEVMSEIVVIALGRAEDFDPEKSARSWLLGIGNFVLMQITEKERKQRAHEITHADLQGSGDDDQGDSDLFDNLISLAQARASIDVAETVTAQLEFERLISLVPPKHAKVLKYAILNDLNGERLAKALHVSADNARQRLHRAVSALREALDRE